jgi:hypothetical protein
VCVCVCVCVCVRVCVCVFVGHHSVVLLVLVVKNCRVRVEDLEKKKGACDYVCAPYKKGRKTNSFLVQKERPCQRRGRRSFAWRCSPPAQCGLQLPGHIIIHIVTSSYIVSHHHTVSHHHVARRHNAVFNYLASK